MVQFPSSIPFVSYLRYSPKGKSDLAVRSQQICYAIKKDGSLDVLASDGVSRVMVRAIDRAASRIAAELDHFPVLTRSFGDDVLLVPVPRSAPIKPGALWPAQRICESLVAHGLAVDILTCLERVKAIPRSATAAPGERASPDDHYQSIRFVQPPLIPPKRITIVDDVVTRGSTFLGLWPHITTAFPGIPVTLFALVRTESYKEIDSVIEPVEGTIAIRYGKPHREP